MKLVLAILATLIASVGMAEITTTKADGGSVVTVLSHNIMVNEGSSLRREWVAVHDSTMPVDLKGTPGVKTIYDSGSGRYSRGDYKYHAGYTLVVAEDVLAVRVNFILFDVWGDRTRVLSAVDVKDLAAGEHVLDGKWRLYSENETSEHYASVAYVAAVRTASGDVYTADTASIVEIAQQYMADFTDDLLEQNPPKAD